MPVFWKRALVFNQWYFSRSSYLSHVLHVPHVPTMCPPCPPSSLSFRPLFYPLALSPTPPPSPDPLLSSPSPLNPAKRTALHFSSLFLPSSTEFQLFFEMHTGILWDSLYVHISTFRRMIYTFLPCTLYSAIACLCSIIFFYIANSSFPILGEWGKNGCMREQLRGGEVIMGGMMGWHDIGGNHEGMGFGGWQRWHDIMIWGKIRRNGKNRQKVRPAMEKMARRLERVGWAHAREEKVWRAEFAVWWYSVNAIRSMVMEEKTLKAKLFQNKHPLDVLRQPRILVFLASVEVFFSSGQCPLAATLQKYSCQFGKTEPKSKSARSLAAKTRPRREIW